MSPINYGTGQTGRIRSFIREKISPRMSWLYAKLGFANRRQLIENIKKSSLDPHLLVEILTARGVLKNRFQEEISSLNDLQDYMLKARIFTQKLAAINHDLDTMGLSEIDTSFYTENAILTKKLINGIVSGYYSVAQYLTNRETLAFVFSKGIKYAALTAGLGTAYWFFGLPSVTPGLILGMLTATAVVATKLNDKLPNYGKWKIIGSILRFASRKAAPFLYAIDGGYLGYLIYESNMNIANIFNSLGLEATVGILLSTYLAIRYWVEKNVSDFNRSYGGHLDPGSRKGMEKLMRSASYSSIADLHYLGARVLLLSAATAFIIGNVGLPFLTTLLPAAGIGITWYLRSKNYFEYSSEKTSKRLDHFKMYAPYYGLGLGLGASAAVSALTDSFVPFIGYTTFWGSFLTLFLTELHGIFHSLNTNMGFISSLKTSAKDLIGERERRELTDKLTLLVLNPNTGIREHTYGLLFSVVLNRKPGVSYLCMYDLPLAEKKGNGLENLENFRNDKAFLNETKKIQEEIFRIIYSNYQEETSDQLASNLSELAT
ncbi:MAG: hypothetical protein ACPL4K_04945, partial [Candidatus Margulisiibacteriota bacterium]